MIIYTAIFNILAWLPIAALISGLFAKFLTYAKNEEEKFRALNLMYSNFLAKNEFQLDE